MSEFPQITPTANFPNEFPQIIPSANLSERGQDQKYLAEIGWHSKTKTHAPRHRSFKIRSRAEMGLQPAHQDAVRLGDWITAVLPHLPTFLLQNYQNPESLSISVLDHSSCFISTNSSSAAAGMPKRHCPWPTPAFRETWWVIQSQVQAAGKLAPVRDRGSLISEATMGQSLMVLLWIAHLYARHILPFLAIFNSKDVSAYPTIFNSDKETVPGLCDCFICSSEFLLELFLKQLLFLSFFFLLSLE